MHINGYVALLCLYSKNLNHFEIGRESIIGRKSFPKFKIVQIGFNGSEVNLDNNSTIRLFVIVIVCLFKNGFIVCLYSKKLNHFEIGGKAA